VTTIDSPRKYAITRPRPAPSASRTAVGPDEDQVRHVRARDEQHHQGGRRDDPERLRDAAGHVILEGYGVGDRLGLVEQHLRRYTGREIRRQLDHARQHCFQVAASIGWRDALPKSGDGVVVETARVGIVRVSPPLEIESGAA
jgi:hypothetical protein